MIITNTEIEGKAAKTTIMLCDDRKAFHVYVDPHNKREKRWDRIILVDVSDAELYKWAREVQYRTDGSHGSNSTVHEYFLEMQRFQN